MYKDLVSKYVDVIEKLVALDQYEYASYAYLSGRNILGEKPRLEALANKYNLYDKTNLRKKEIDYLERIAGLECEARKIFEKSSKDKFIIKELPAEEVLYNKPPKLSHYYAFKDFHFKRKRRDIYEIKNAFLSVDFSKPYKTDFYFFDEAGRYISEISDGPEPFLIEHAVNIKKKVAFIDDRFTKFNICHLLFDKLSRVIEFEKENVHPDEYILFDVNTYVTEIGDVLGINFFDFSTNPGRRFTFKFDVIYFSSSSTYSHQHPGQLGYDCWKEISYRINDNASRASDREFPKKFFIDRRSGSTRNVINENQFYDFLYNMKIEPVKLEELNLIEQISLFRNAELIIGVHGAGFANLMFASKNARVIEILPALCATKAFWIASEVFGLNYDPFLAKDPEVIVDDYSKWTHRADLYNRRSVFIDIEDFEEHLGFL